MQTDHRVPTINTAAMRDQQHRKRSSSSVNSRKRDRHDLICVVCLAPAMGYNFDQITCESCKAFFRRNALTNAGKLKCRAGTENCIITLETRKRCKACRLKKCFEKGLRKEWIMSEEEKRTKKQKIEDNRRLRAMTQSSTIFSLTPAISPFQVSEVDCFNFPKTYQKHFIDDGEEDDKNSNDNKDGIFLFDDNQDIVDFKLTHNYSINDSNNPDISNGIDYKSLLEENDRILITKIEENYARAVELNISIAEDYNLPCVRNLHHLTNIVNELTHISTLRTITFLKLTPEFNSLNEEDRIALVKHNLLASLFFHLCMCVDRRTNIYHEPNTSHDFCYNASELRLYSEDVYHDSMIFIEEVQNICSNDHLIMKLAMLIMIFTKGSDLNEPVWHEPQKIFHAQNVFINLLWKYLDIRFGKELTPLIYSRLIFACMHAQILGRKTKEAVIKQTVNNEHLAPLMQSVLLSS